MSKILAVDDNPDLLRLISEMFGDDYEVITASNGKEAIDTVLREMPDLILIDVKMPVMDGIAATKVLKGDMRTRFIPIIMLTGHDAGDDMILGLESGADDYVGKPFRPRILLARVQAHLRTKAMYDDLEAIKRDTEIILDVTESTGSSLHITDVLQAVTEKVAEYLNLDRCSIILIDEKRENGLVLASSDVPDVGGLSIDLDKYPEITQVIETGETLIIENAVNDPLMAGVMESAHYNFMSLMVVPIVFKEEIIGTLLLRTKKRDGGFSEREAELCRIIANSAASAIRNASLFEKLEEKSMEIEEANKRLLELDRLKSSFLAMAAHELRTPMSLISGYLEMVLDGVAGPLDPKQGDLLKIALDNSTGLARILEEMLDISVIESGKVSLDLERWDMDELINGALLLVEGDAGKKGISVEANVEKVSVIIDGKRIKQVLINLLTNAIKFTDAGGEIVVDVEDGGNELTVSVSDTGRGIPEEDIDRVFDEFYRGSSQEVGAGLGLPICKRIIDMHGGRIWVESRVGEGSTFYFTLPKKESGKD